MKITVIGQSVIDHINDSVKPGGIFYTVTGLQNYIEQDDEILLITSVSKDTYFQFADLYSNVNTEYTRFVKKIPEVKLKINTSGERKESYLRMTEKLIIPPEFDFSDSDGILINMITGFDIDLNDLANIRLGYSGPIYFDVHTLSRGINEKGERFFRRIPGFDEWIKLIDIMQVNENELFTLSDSKNSNDIIKEVLNLGLKCLIVTRGKRGASIYYINNSIIQSEKVDPISINAVNTVGCGDIFGAVFFYSYIMSRNYHSSFKIANSAAGVSTTYSSFEEFKRIKTDADKYIDKK